MALFTATFGFVANLELPPFDEPPMVVLWGDRFFVREARGVTRGTDVSDRVSYYEVFAYVVPVTA